MTEPAGQPDTVAASSDQSPAQPVAWKLLLIPAVAQLLLHLLTNGR